MIKLVFFLLAFLITPVSFALPEEFCSYPMPIIPTETEQNLVEISDSGYAVIIKDCFMTAAGASYESIEDAVECIGSPIDCAESAVDGISKIYDALKNISEELKKMWNTISSLNPSQAREMICTVIGSIAPDIVIAALSGGAASGKLGVTLAKMSLKIKKMVEVLKNTVLLPVKLVSELTDEALDSISKVLKSSRKKDFEADLRRTGCAIR